MAIAGASAAHEKTIGFGLHHFPFEFRRSAAPLVEKGLSGHSLRSRRNWRLSEHSL
jgi:hypothetical protein